MVMNKKNTHDDVLTKSIICFAEDWGRFPSSAQEIMARLSSEYKILWVDSLGLRPPQFCLADLQRIWYKIKKWFQGTDYYTVDVEKDYKIILYTPLVIPYHRYRFVRWINQWLLILSIRFLMRKYNLTHRILWIACPAAAGMVGKLNEEKSIYYCADEYAEFPGMSRPLVDKLENRLLQKVNWVLVTSQTLLTKKREKYAGTFYIPHGVDFAHFAKATQEDTPIPDEMKLYSKPILGYFGLIQDLIDFELIRFIAQSRSEWSLVMIGPKIFDVQYIPDLPNLHLLGQKPYAMLPNYIKSFDVCLIPYKLTPRTVYANPLKLRQYLAAGKPVVSTPGTEALRYRDVIRIGQTHEQFFYEIEQALANNSSEEVKKRMERVRPEAWEIVLPKIKDFL